MKKIVLSLAGVMATAAFAPEASALPVFARQTGMACTACHYQHFPLLNGFGRAFKSSAYTLMGAQGKVEGDNLSIPDRLNMAVFATAGMQGESGGDIPTKSTATIGDAGNGNASYTAGNSAAKNYTGSQSRYFVPSSGGELSIFYGGKVTDFAGFLSELALTSGGSSAQGIDGNTATVNGGAANTNSAKLVALFPVGDDMHAGLSAYSTTGAGAAYSFEYLNTGAVQNHRMMANAGQNNQHISAAYAGMYLGTAGNATGVSAVVNNSMGFVNIGKYAPAGAGTGNANDLPLTYARVAATFDMAGWDTAVGVQHFDGNSSPVTGVTYPGTDYTANIIDAQAQGELAGMETGFYVSYGNAPSSNNGNALIAGGSTIHSADPNFSNKNMAATTLNLATSIEIVPHAATVQLAYRKATLTPDTTTQTYQGGDDNAYMIGATYELAMNMGLGINYTVQSGSAWDNADKAWKNAGVAGAMGQTAWTLLLETAF